VAAEGPGGGMWRRGGRRDTTVGTEGVQQRTMDGVGEGGARGGGREGGGGGGEERRKGTCSTGMDGSAGTIPGSFTIAQFEAPEQQLPYLSPPLT
jgi:hypothetical protein